MLSPPDLLDWTFAQQRPIIVTTSFGNHAAVLIDMVSQYQSVPIVWVDTQFNTPQTLAFKDTLVQKYKLDLRTYVGEPWTKEIPFVDTPEHDEFVERVKLAPFRRALADLKPEFWITGIRREQTSHRSQLRMIDQVNGLTKISPLLEWREHNLDAYIKLYNLPNEPRYFDPTKMHEGRECGLHTHNFSIDVAVQ